MMKNTLKKLIDETTKHHTVEWASDDNLEEQMEEQNIVEVIPAEESFLHELKETNIENINVQFREDTDLGHICQAISSNLSLTLPAGITYEEMTPLMVENIDKYLTSENGSRYLEDIKRYSALFSEKITDAFNILKTQVAPEIDNLANQIELRAADFYKLATTQNNLNGVDTYSEPEFTVVNLNNFRSEEAIVCGNELVSKYMNNKVDTINGTTLRYIVDNFKNFNQLNVSNDDIERWSSFVLEKLNKEDASDTFKKEITSIISTSFNLYEFNKLKDLIINKDIRSGKFNESAIRNASSFVALSPVFEYLDNAVDLIDDNELAKFKENMNTINDLKKVAIVLLALSSEKFGECVAIGPKMLNLSGLTKFQETGGTKEDISNHIRLYHNTNKDDILYDQVMHNEMPATGISVETLVSNMDYTRDKMSTLNKKAETQLRTVANDCVKKAFDSVLRDYIFDIENNHPEMISGITPHQFGINARKLIPTITYNLVRFEKDNITDAIYEFYLKLWYKDSLVSNIYYRLGAVLIDTINNDEEDTNEEAMENAHFTVMSDILSDFITKTMIVPSK